MGGHVTSAHSKSRTLRRCKNRLNFYILATIYDLEIPSQHHMAPLSNSWCCWRWQPAAANQILNIIGIQLWAPIGSTPHIFQIAAIKIAAEITSFLFPVWCHLPACHWLNLDCNWILLLIFHFALVVVGMLVSLSFLASAWIWQASSKFLLASSNSSDDSL